MVQGDPEYPEDLWHQVDQSLREGLETPELPASPEGRFGLCLLVVQANLANQVDLDCRLCRAVLRTPQGQVDPEDLDFQAALGFQWNLSTKETP